MRLYSLAVLFFTAYLQTSIKFVAPLKTIKTYNVYSVTNEKYTSISVSLLLFATFNV
jgi:hypothetical protein